MLDAFLPAPRLVKIDHVDVAASPIQAYAVARSFDLGQSPLVRALFALRTLLLELRVDATSEDAWAKQRRYFRLIGPFSHFIRRRCLSRMEHELGGFDADAQTQALPGDDLIAAPKACKDIWHAVGDAIVGTLGARLASALRHRE